jgi:predicted aspartyl protease
MSIFGPGRIKSVRLLIFYGAGCLCWWSGCHRASGAEVRITGSVESYLKRQGYISIVLERDQGNLLYVRPIFKGKKQRFTLDTGASGTLIDKGFATDLKKIDGVQVKLDDKFLENVTDPALVLIENLQIGPLEFRNQPAFLASVAGNVFSDQKGILGCDFCVRHNAIIDCARRRLFVRTTTPSVEARTTLAQTLRRSGYVEVPMELTAGFPLACMAKANDEPLKLVVDTGASWNLLDERWGRVRKLSLNDTNVRVVGIGEIGSHAMQITRLQKFELGELVLKDTYFGLTSLDAWGLSDRGKWMPDTNGLLGADTLADNGALIDYASMTLWVLKPNSRN